VWRSTALRLTLAAPPLLATMSVLVLPESWLVRLFAIGLLGLSLLQPRTGLLLLTVVVFLGYFRQPIPHDSIRPHEAWAAFNPAFNPVWPFLAGWLLVARSDRRGPRVPGLAAWSVAAIACASAIVGIWNDEWMTVRGGAIVVSGLGLMAATVTLFRWHPRMARDLPLAMVSSALAGAAIARGLPGVHINVARTWTERCAGGATELLALSSLAMAGLVLLRCGSALTRSRRDFRLLACGLGLAVMTATWLVEPCRALSEQALPGWILAGLAAGLSGSALIETTALPPAAAGTAEIRA